MKITIRFLLLVLVFVPVTSVIWPKVEREVKPRAYSVVSPTTSNRLEEDSCCKLLPNINLLQLHIRDLEEQVIFERAARIKARKKIAELEFEIAKLTDQLKEQGSDTVHETRRVRMDKRRTEADIAAFRTDLGDAIRAQRALSDRPESLRLGDEPMLEQA